MNFEDAIKLIEEQKIIAVKVLDYKEHLIVRIEEGTPIEVQNKLESYKNSLMPYGKVTFIAADQKCKNSSWRDALHWHVTFTGVQPVQNNLPGVMPMGFVSPQEALLQRQLFELQQKVEFDKRISELEAKFSKNKGGGFDDIIKYLPLLPLFIKIDPDKAQQMNGIIAAMNPDNSTQPGISGLGATVKGTPEEEKVLDELENEVVELTGKVDPATLRDIIKTLNEDPSLIPKLAALISTFKK